MTLSINAPNHPLNLLGNEPDSEESTDVDLAFFLVRKQKEADRYYRAKAFSISEELSHWLKRQLIKEIRAMQIKEDDGSRRFVVSEYHLEVQKHGRLAKLTLGEEIGLPYERKNALLGALANPDGLLDVQETDFQVIQADVDGERLYFFFYRKPKQSASRKKWALGRSGELDFASDELIELGGKIDFMLVGDELYISNLLSFENVFDYRDHIVSARDRNLETITNMPFFAIDELDKERFKRDCSAIFHTRTLAQLGAEQLETLEENFKDRCSELRQIRNGVPSSAERAEEYRRTYAPLWELYDFLDLDHEVIMYPEGSRPTALLHFFADKIVQSFLTKEFGLADSIDSAGDRQEDNA
ncbi:Kiwa anti-phage protein KwaB-like domain-containing protein [Saccharibacillus kuerlensis]|uniref:DUF4868 domain-containing protein n=1 Tax=Saccharibacillus kuerlensis TaxID=459527 RepID=A0ABQ2KXZ4_9BACL|nr:Kiwa anti-phage protein KwaB-like domain-containing protein [Saccharibacillus kuerlensis]GGN95799.1 hypothetical protein GCM10010969_12040 [Saccharibacillus kuerlensis]